MKVNRRELARTSLQQAVRLRKKLGISIYEAVCPYDSAEKLGIEVHFIDIPSLEGMYMKGKPPIIIISSLRPSGRTAYTCAHEIGHHVFNHGTRVDEYLENLPVERNSPEEIIAQTFAGFFLMPKSAVERGLFLRGKTIESARPIDIYTLSCWFGVGYETLINHAEYGLKILSSKQAEALRNLSPKQIKSSLLGNRFDGNLIVVDKFWTGRTIDAQVGDIILLPNTTQQNNEKVCQVINTDSQYTLFRAVAPGRGRFSNSNSGWAAFVRVSRQGFTGRSVFRHLEDPEYE